MESASVTLMMSDLLYIPSGCMTYSPGSTSAVQMPFGLSWQLSVALTNPLGVKRSLFDDMVELSEHLAVPPMQTSFSKEIVFEMNDFESLIKISTDF